MGSVLLSAEVKTWPQHTPVAMMKSSCSFALIVVAVFVVGFAQGKSVHHQKAGKRLFVGKQSNAFASAETLKMLMKRMKAGYKADEVTTPTAKPEPVTNTPTTPEPPTDAPTTPVAEEPVTIFTPEQIEQIDALELTTCGEDGIAGAFLHAFQEVPVLPEQLDCPAYDDYIWTLVAEDPFVMCLMEPAHLRVGLECIRRYMEESPVPELYMMDAEIMQYLNNTAEQPEERLFGLLGLGVAAGVAYWGRSEDATSKINMGTNGFLAHTDGERLFGLLSHVVNAEDATSTIMGTNDDIPTPTAEEVQALDNLETAMCGEGGLGAAFSTAFQPEVSEEMPEELPCPAYDAYIWKFVAEDPLTMCLMDPLHLRIGVECIYQYLEESPVPALYVIIDDAMQANEGAMTLGTEMKKRTFSSLAQDTRLCIMPGYGCKSSLARNTRICNNGICFHFGK